LFVLAPVQNLWAGKIATFGAQFETAKRKSYWLFGGVLPRFPIHV
jgi:hypothetical protein